jgi:hypothetical protein
MEESVCCKVLGRIGLIRPENEKARFWLLHVGFIANLIAFVLTLYSALAISDDYDTLRAASFSKIGVTEPNSPLETIIQLDVGLRAAALNLPHTEQKIVINFDEFCDLPSESLKLFLDDTDVECSRCEDISTSMVVSVIVSVITFIPSFSTDILRMYSNYDVNCQKVFSTLFAAVTLLLSLNTLLKYNQSCFAAFYSGKVPFDQNITLIQDDAAATNAAFLVDFDWSMGPGLACLYAGTVSKAVDIVFNLLVPSPTITRDHKEQWDYENLTEEEEGEDPKENPDEEE